MKQAVVGILAHVDAGKTTLAEALLYQAGTLRSRGRVDDGSSFLDFDQTERSRGITIYSSLGSFDYGNTHVMLLDTPGHVDFSTEAERVLHVLDYALLVVDASSGVQGHTLTLWRLLERYGVPTLVFFNKMDLEHASRDELISAAEKRLGGCLFDASPDTGDRHSCQMERMALTCDDALEEFLESGTLGAATVARLFAQRRISPCFFGSALKGEGVTDLLTGLDAFAAQRSWPATFSARAFKVTHDPRGTRLLWLKVTGGTLRTKTSVNWDNVRTNALTGTAAGANWDAKVEQIRVYSGAKFEAVSEVPAGQICAVMGLPQVEAGAAIGPDEPAPLPALVPVLAYRVNYGSQDVHVVTRALQVLTEEDPCLSCAWNAELQELQVRIMGEIQLEVLQATLQQRFDLQVSFEEGSVLYTETITGSLRGVGHFEPLRHYAEVHYQLDPRPRGTGMSFGSVCKLDDFDLNWQRLTLANAQERTHRGVLMGAPLVDVGLTLLGGRAHLKHTEGGDFRQATYRAIRQGLMEGRQKSLCQLLEPWYTFDLILPADKLGKALADLQRMSARFEAPQMDEETAHIKGTVPVAEVRSYPLELAAFTGGRASLSCVFAGYEPCHNTEEVLAAHPYDPEADLPHSPDSVFCAHGAGYTVKWPDVPAAAHVEIDPRNLGPYISASEL